jgi:hypothetical protein|tara:strand:- start:29567 stop:30190 length:624 start_codon:yes stop_codon:yes gene_type:complete
MITRDVAQIKSLSAVIVKSYDASCGSNDGTTSNEVKGRIIDRLGLGTGYTAALISATGWGDIGTSTASGTKFMTVGARLLHSSTTCADDFSELSTAHRATNQALFLTGNTTSTLASGFMATSTSVGTFGVFTATATGSAAGESNAFLDLTGAQRFIQAALLWNANASSSGGSALHEAGVDISFGAPDVVPLMTTSTAPVYLTTCNDA